MSGRYRQHAFAPGRSLLCRWEYVQGTEASPALVLPDACVDLLWDGERLRIAGPDTRAQYARIAPGRRINGLRFAPGAATRWLGVPLHVLADQRVDLRDLGIPRLATLADRMAERDAEAMAWLADRIQADTPPRSDAISASPSAPCCAGATRRSATDRSCWRASCGCNASCDSGTTTPTCWRPPSTRVITTPRNWRAMRADSPASRPHG